jgi:hypothetical protein
MSADDEREKEFLERLSAVMGATPEGETEAVRDAVALAVERCWLGAPAAARAARLLVEGAALDAARLLVPAGWSVTVEAVGLPPVSKSDLWEIAGPDHAAPRAAKIVYLAKSAPEGIPIDSMAIRFGPEDACHMPDSAFSTAVLALCGEAMMLQLNLAEERMAVTVVPAPPCERPCC